MDPTAISDAVTFSTFLWVFGAGLVPGIGWAIGITIWMMRIGDRTACLPELHSRLTKLNDQHDNPEKTGFGTKPLEDLVRENTKALDGLRGSVDLNTEVLKMIAREPPRPAAVGGK